MKEPTDGFGQDDLPNSFQEKEAVGFLGHMSPAVYGHDCARSLYRTDSQVHHSTVQATDRRVASSVRSHASLST